MLSEQIEKQSKKRLYHKLCLICFVIIFLLCIFIGYLITMDMRNISDDIMAWKYDETIHENNTKLRFAKSYEKQQQKQAESDREEKNNNSTSIENTSGIKDGKLIAKEHGELIADTTLNPSGLPLYDGWTLDIDKLKEVAIDLDVDPSTVVSFDLNYEQFWSSDEFKDNPALYGLGDFTNSKEGSNNMISYGTTLGIYKSCGDTKIIQTPIGNVTTFDNRILFAVPGRLLTDPSLLTDEMLSKLNDNCGLTRTSPTTATADYSRCYRLTYNQWENMVHDWTNCCPSSYYHKGMYFDILFDDGSVLAATEADGKGVHVGDDGNGSYCEDTLASGYGQVRFSKSDPNKVGYQSILEIYSPGAKNNGLDIGIQNKRIVGIRCYTIGGKDLGFFTKWWELSKQK